MSIGLSRVPVRAPKASQEAISTYPATPVAPPRLERLHDWLGCFNGGMVKESFIINF